MTEQLDLGNIFSLNVGCYHFKFNVYKSVIEIDMSVLQQDFLFSMNTDDEDGAEGPPNIFTVIYVTNDKDSGRGSPDTDTICTPPPDNSPTLNPLSVCNMSDTNLQ